MRRGAGKSPTAATLMAVTAIALTTPAALLAQRVPAPPAAEADSIELRPPVGVSPTGAFLRALAVPGWGHAAIGSYTRGGFYFAFETATAYAFIRTRMRLNEARDRADFWEGLLRADLADQGVTDPAEIDTRLEGDETLQSFRDLVSSREGQQEDLVAFGIFLLLLTGADAYVSAHLSRFPAPIEVQGAYTDDGRAEVGVRVRIPR